MDKRPDPKSSANENAFLRHVAAKETRRLKAQRKGTQTVWSGVAMFGIVGWSVAAPTLAGALIGVWVDKHYPSPHSWTLALLVAGLVIGCAIAWHWVDKEYKRIQKDENNGKQE
ncbi:TPA: F0F1 ATP synthase subunit [Candidatus Sumerlaeota bacterium]|jgi:ATP synthase protein I|nr:F0F1 ATP synthase subunit [Candidatus Sumerlaeota bacterium]